MNFVQRRERIIRGYSKEEKLKERRVEYRIKNFKRYIWFIVFEIENHNQFKEENALNLKV